MKIIQILPELNSGGVERGTLEVGKYLVEQGHESLVISNGGRLVAQLEAEGSRHITLPVHKKRLGSLKQVKVLRQLFETEKPDILHLRSRLPAWLAYLAWRKMDPQTRPRLVTTVHGFNSVNAYSKIMTRGEAVICVSKSIRDFVLEKYPDVSAERLVVVHRGIDPQTYDPSFKPSQEWLEKWSAEFPETRGKQLLTLPGRITRLKGHEDFLHVLASIKDQGYHGIIAGGADPRKQDYLNEVKRKVDEMDLKPFVTFTGHRSDLKEILASSCIVFSLTQQPESFGRTTLEALALGIPVIGYQHGGVGEILDALFSEGKVQLGDTRSIIHRINEWETSDSPPIPSQETPFTLQAMLEATLQAYTQLLQTGHVQVAFTS